jgi:hypothetical protein
LKSNTNGIQSSNNLNKFISKTRGKSTTNKHTKHLPVENISIKNVSKMTVNKISGVKSHCAAEKIIVQRVCREKNACIGKLFFNNGE